MSNDADNNEEFYLRFGGVEPEESGVPLLPPFYAYLLKLSPRVGLVDIYPWLAEVIFYSDVVSKENAQNGESGGPPNVITFFIDDHKDNIANAMAPDEDSTEEWSDDFARYCHIAWTKEKEVKSNQRPRIFVVDTYGEFHRPKELNERLDQGIGGGKNNATLYVRSALAGAGNPARMLQKFSSIGRLPKVPPALKMGEELDLGALNVFVFNSITYLTRTIGFREAMQLIRAILERGVWKPNPPNCGDQERLCDKDGLFFAILHEGVHSADEIRYAETFFDGIIRFDAYYHPFDSIKENEHKKKRQITYAFEQFPLLRFGAEPNKLEPDYGYACSYLPRGGRRLLSNGALNKIPLEYIFPQGN